MEETEPPHTEEQFEDEPGDAQDAQSFRDEVEPMDEDHNDDDSYGARTQK